MRKYFVKKIISFRRYNNGSLVTRIDLFSKKKNRLIAYTGLFTFFGTKQAVPFSHKRA
jgi:hypothetical protein